MGQQVVSWLLGAGAISAVLLLLAIGFWTLYVSPKIYVEIQTWLEKPAQQTMLTALIKKRIEDEVIRTDGSIYAALDKHVTEQGKQFQAKFDEVLAGQQESNERLARIEGMLVRVPSSNPPKKGE